MYTKKLLLICILSMNIPCLSKDGSSDEESTFIEERIYTNDTIQKMHEFYENNKETVNVIFTFTAGITCLYMIHKGLSGNVYVNVGNNDNGIDMQMIGRKLTADDVPLLPVEKPGNVTQGNYPQGSSTLNYSGGSCDTVTVNSKNIYINISGGSDITLKGNCETIYVTSSGQSNLNLQGLNFKNISYVISGDTIITHSNTNPNILKAKATGNSKIKYQKFSFFGS